MLLLCEIEGVGEGTTAVNGSIIARPVDCIFKDQYTHTSSEICTTNKYTTERDRRPRAHARSRTTKGGALKANIDYNGHGKLWGD